MRMNSGGDLEICYSPEVLAELRSGKARLPFDEVDGTFRLDALIPSASPSTEPGSSKDTIWNATALRASNVHAASTSG